MIKEFFDGVEIERRDRAIICTLKRPHRVISTCRVNGGLREDIGFVVNHQAQEPKDDERHRKIVRLDPKSYHRDLCGTLGIPPEKTVLLGTAANMNNAGFFEESYRDIAVLAISTAGVETNAGRVGDPSQVYEWEGSFEDIWNGTINIMVFVNWELTPGAMVRAVKTATEAKTSILQELSIPSRYSTGIATGTGTDQIAVASLLVEGAPLTSSGKHSKLGELIGVTVRSAVREALSLQNKITPEERRYLPRLLERFGYNEERVVEFLRKNLTSSLYSLFEKNRLAILSDPALIAHALSFLHLIDQMNWGVVPRGCSKEVYTHQAALISSAVSFKPLIYSEFYGRLSRVKFKDPVELLLLGVVEGLKEKWR